MNNLINKTVTLLKTTVLLSAVILLAASCSTHKNQLPYFQSISESEQGVLPATVDYQIKIVPDDELSITVNSESPAATAPYNLPMYNPMVQKDVVAGATEKNISTTPQSQTYIVDSKGDIDMPVLGKIHVEGMTVEALTDYLTERISREVKDPIVRVTLVNFRVNVLGEVASPRSIKVTRQKYSVLDALADCGDLTQYGMRENVLVMRKMPDGTVSYQRLDLRDASITSSPYFYLTQNDVVYVEPNQIKQSNSRYDSMNSYKLSTVSTIVSAASVIASLVIALTVK